MFIVPVSSGMLACLGLSFVCSNVRIPFATLPFSAASIVSSPDAFKRIVQKYNSSLLPDCGGIDVYSQPNLKTYHLCACGGR